MAAKSNRRRLADKVAIVTGSGAGIGRAEAMLFAAQGARVVVNDIGVKDGAPIAARVIEEIRSAGGEAVASTNNVAELQGAEQLVKTALDAFGRLDILVNNAGITNFIPVHELSERDWDRMMAVHLKGSFGTIKYASPIMCRQRSGVIINTGSESGLGRVFGANYCAAKEGIIGLTRAVAKEVGRFNVRCNAIRPRAATTIAEGINLKKFLPVMRALGRYWVGTRAPAMSSMEVYKPEAVAPLVVWLCTDAAANVNGRDFYIAGNEVGLFPELEVERLLYREEGWDLDALDRSAREHLVGDLVNRYLLDGYPELQRFEE
ncbi:MAG: SDR family NAD(P)-dependent oxidoreductase [Deltaproteobacteria bacterium]|nr:SDR family NAD(P)-dependent oxidoreductase [Deltaproteobacteria bacterium]